VTPPGGSVRRARESDLDDLTRLWKEIAAHHAPLDPVFALRPDAGGAIRRMLAAQLADDDAAVFVWEEAAQVVALCTVRIDQAPPIQVETRRAEICDIGVAATARRRGVGRALARTASDWARKRGIARIEVRVAVGNREGQTFWRCLGYGDLLDVMHRRL